MATTKKQTAKKNNLNAVAKQLIELAERGGVEQNFFFVTTFSRYKTQLNTLTRLQKEIDESDVLIEKEYVRGRPNIVANPAIGEYNKTSTAANQTVATLLKIITTFADGPVLGAATDDGGDIDL